MNSKSTLTYILLLLNKMLSTISSEQQNKNLEVFKYFKAKFTRPHIKIGTYGHQECFYLPRNYIALKKSGPLELLINIV